MQVNKILSEVVEKIGKNQGLKDFPHITKNGKWVTTKDGYWTGGFLVGLCWFSYKTTGGEKYKEAGRTIIDVMRELPLLWWGYEETGEEKFFNIAYIHSKRTIEEFVREDYSTIHVIDFDLKTGEIIRKITVQGYSDDSCWSRGQAWAIYGFALAYKYTKDEAFLKVAENLAEYYIENLPEDYVSYWDFDAPKKVVRDSSAAAITSSGLLDLSALSGKEEFRNVAINILNSLCNNYVEGEEEGGILKYGCLDTPEAITTIISWNPYSISPNYS